MTINFDFLPDPVRAERLDRRMHRELGASLAHVREQSLGLVPFDAAALDRLVRHLEQGGRVAPEVFARYYELVSALIDGDEGKARALFAELAEAGYPRDGLQVVVLGSSELGRSTDRYIRMMSAESDIGFQAPDPALAEAFRGRLARGLALLESTLPELAGEIRGIIRQIVISGSDPGKTMQFDGGSHYQLWGALFLNCNFHHDDIAVAEVLAHESAHSLLFGFCTHETLVENEDDELFASPLRPDLRPMDGIYHATFVSARMHWAMSRLADSPLLSADQQAQARAAADLDLRNFHAGLAVVREHGRLTPLGAELLAGAEASMPAMQRAA